MDVAIKHETSLQRQLTKSIVADLKRGAFFCLPHLESKILFLRVNVQVYNHMLFHSVKGGIKNITLYQNSIVILFVLICETYMCWDKPAVNCLTCCRWMTSSKQWHM